MAGDRSIPSIAELSQVGVVSLRVTLSHRIGIVELSCGELPVRERRSLELLVCCIRVSARELGAFYDLRLIILSHKIRVR